MGCGSSGSQVANVTQASNPIKQLLVLEHSQNVDLTEGRIFLFGETRTNRKII